MKDKYTTKIVKNLANLQFAIILLFTIGLIISVGTIIEQDQTIGFYKQSYPYETPVFGFLTWKVILVLGLDHLYSTWWFLLLLFLFVGSLLACTFTNQLPSVKTFKIWKFYNQPTNFKKLSISSNIQLESSSTFAYHCNRTKHHFFRQQKKGYAYCGLLGRLGPIVVHASIIILLFGSSLGSLGGYSAQALIPRGEVSHIQNLINFGELGTLPQNLSIRVNDFWITYTKEFKTAQFYSDLSIIDYTGTEIKRKTVFVNEPLLFENIVLYQTDWDIIGIKVRLTDGNIFQVPVKKIIKNGQKFWLGSINLDASLNISVNLLINDLQSQFFLYDEKGILINTFDRSQFISLPDGNQIMLLDYITSTGLQIKYDPGISTVYLSFLLLMLSTYVSFLTYSQIWLVEENNTILVGGKSNRAVLFFQEEFRKLLKLTNRI